MVGVAAISSVLKTDVPSGIASSSLAPSAKNIYAAFVSYFTFWVFETDSQVLFYMFFIWGINSVG